MQRKLFMQLRLAVFAMSGALTMGLPCVGEPAVESFHVPVEYYKLPNGLRVVLSPDHTAPTVCIGVYYRIGFRIEPRDRTGFAHLFEHMMFQGSTNLGKMEFIKLVQSNGGILNGSTRFDFTKFFEALPSNRLETALWAEADRMKTYVAKVNAVSPHDVQKMTAQYLKPQSMTIVAVGDKSKIFDQLAPFQAGKPL